LLEVAKKINYLFLILNFEIGIESVCFNDVLIVLAVASGKTHDIYLLSLGGCLRREERINAKFEQRDQHA